MKALVKCLILIATIFISLSASASPETLKCYFKEGVTATLSGSDINLEKNKGFKNEPIIFDKINLKTNKARMIGNVGTASIYATPSDGGFTFIEITPSGNMVVTSIYSQKNEQYFAVMSRHMDILGEVIISQQYGFCSELL